MTDSVGTAIEHVNSCSTQLKNDQILLLRTKSKFCIKNMLCKYVIRNECKVNLTQYLYILHKVTDIKDIPFTLWPLVDESFFM